MEDFSSGFWGIYIAAIVVISLAGLLYLLRSQSVVKLPKGQKADVTGHKWDDDLEEYNNPLPRWWMWLFYLTIFFAIGYLVLYPGLVVWKGSNNWTAAGQFKQERDKKDAEIKPLYDKFMQQDVVAVSKSTEAREIGQRLFMTYCIQCHGSDAHGAKGFPNLTDDDWLYGGSPEKIVETISNGRGGQMPAFGAQFGEEGVKDVANHVLKIAGKKFDAERATRGEANFKTVCAACHGPDGKGNQAIGAPNLTDKTWLYGGSETTIIETITNGRKNYMPAWKEFLGDAKVHLLAGYVYGLSHQEGEAAKAK
ncbi:cytochrome-c oxidase, cbb3-type subunit III [Parachitinimonas caeni]|uniref:Cbb3-type cytochrome c oxidase subunit n=1 Tax=Parachitinimonas caeni TaxID=3031301 RepID=A0ABT7DX87_9NEIS|nr:cytochrome-c oxidase, cbb3-type subunit III [Parachitinimonas caeni]MDK2124655.1 cytochrome-c oxidase, cbb3-type subunit III [Parachitinimonas caeni]